MTTQLSTPSQIADAIEDQRRRLAEAECDQASEARAEIARLEAEQARLAELDAERAAEQEQLAERWRELVAQAQPAAAALLQRVRELAALRQRDLALATARGNATGDPNARRGLLRLQSPAVPPRVGKVEQLVHILAKLELHTDAEPDETFRVISRAEPERPHFPTGGDRSGTCINDSEPWPCPTAVATMAAREGTARACVAPAVLPVARSGFRSINRRRRAPRDGRHQAAVARSARAAASAGMSSSSDRTVRTNAARASRYG